VPSIPPQRAPRPEAPATVSAPWRKIGWWGPWLLMGLVWLASAWLLWPGWLFNDSAVQWTWAQELVARGEWTATTQWPLLMTLIKVPFVIGTTRLGLYGALQAGLFFGAMAWLIAALSTASLRRTLLVALGLASPIAWNYAWLHSSDALTLAAMAAVLGVVARRDRLRPWLRTGIAAGAIALISGARYDGFIVGAVLALALMLLERPRPLALPRVPQLSAMALLALALAGPLCINANLHNPLPARPLHTQNPGLTLTLWHTGALARLEPWIGGEQRRALLQEQASKPFPQVCLRMGMWCEPFAQIRDELVNDLTQGHLLWALQTHAVEEPGRTARVLGVRFLRQAGVTMPLSELEIGRYIGPQRMFFDQVATPRRTRAVALLYGAEGALGAMLVRPWPWVLALLLPLSGSARLRRPAVLLLPTWLIYLLAMSVIGPFADVRYQLLFLLPAQVLVLAALMELGSGRWAPRVAALLGRRRAEASDAPVQAPPP
jgi:hypothetical protein